MPSLTRHLALFGVAAISGGGCGYAGLGLDASGDVEGSGGATAHAGGTTGGDGDAMNLGGSMGGGLGEGGTQGTGGAFAIPPFPCSTECLEPFLLYRSFELGIPGQVKEDPGAIVERSTEIVHGGEHSLCTAQGEPGTDAQITDAIDGVVEGQIYFRAWMYVPQGAITDWLEVLAFNGPLTEGLAVNLLDDGGVEILSHISNESSQSDAGLIPQGEWFCLQTHSVIDDTNGSFEVFVNEDFAVSLDQVDTLPATRVDNIVYGIAETGPEQTGAALYFDDIVVSTKPVDCEPSL